jgi:hypothetical protein
MGDTITPSCPRPHPKHIQAPLKRSLRDGPAFPPANFRRHKVLFANCVSCSGYPYPTLRPSWTTCLSAQ